MYWSPIFPKIITILDLKLVNFKSLKRNYVGNYCECWQYEQLKCKSVKFVTLGSEWIKLESNTFVNLGSG